MGREGAHGGGGFRAGGDAGASQAEQDVSGENSDGFGGRAGEDSRDGQARRRFLKGDAEAGQGILE